MLYILFYEWSKFYFSNIFRTKELYVLLGLAVIMKVDALASYVCYDWVVRASQFM